MYLSHHRIECAALLFLLPSTSSLRDQLAPSGAFAPEASLRTARWTATSPLQLFVLIYPSNSTISSQFRFDMVMPLDSPQPTFSYQSADLSSTKEEYPLSGLPLARLQASLSAY